AAIFVATERALGHHAFEALLPGGFQQLFALPGEMLGVAQRRIRADQRMQQALALAERDTAQVVAVEVHQVESEERDAGGGDARLAKPHTPLQRAEAGAALRVERDDLAVDDGLLRRDVLANAGEL